MFKVFRIVFALAAAALIVACVFIGIFAGMVPFWCCVGGAVLLFALSMLFKYLQEEREKKDAPAIPAVPAATPDTDGAEADGSRTADGGANGQNKGKGEAAEADAPAAGGSAARGGEPTQTDKP